jgi:N-acetylmuramoyl-L-alanine amidase
MLSESDSINRLKDPKQKVSCHYLINRQGKITQMVKDENIAWHAGKSKWKNFENLNDNSLGIELVNKGHEFGYQNFSTKQIKSLIELCKKLKRKYFINNENFLGHSDIAPLRKIDPGEKFPWKRLSNYKLGRWYKNKLIINKENKQKMETLFYKNLKKIGYRYFSIKKRTVSDKEVVKIFQQHFLPKNVTGRIDNKTFKISQLLT